MSKRNSDDDFHSVTDASSILNSGAKASKSPKKIQDEVDHQESSDDVEVVVEDTNVEDGSGFTMGEIVVDSNNAGEDDEDVQILKAASKKATLEEEDEGDDVWVDDVDVFDDSDDFLSNEDYDPENGYFDQ